MKEIPIQEFVRRLKKVTEESADSKFSLFLGAGASYSSGIPLAGTLVRRWLPELKELKTGNRDNWEEWAGEYFEGFDEENPALLYSEVFGERFDSKETQQREIEKLTRRKEPGFGYAVLAQLMSHEKFGNNFSMVLTTNFDDMVADALYLFTNKKPLVIVHESLISYVRLTRARALVLKLHGDALLDPKNTRLETEELDKAVKETVKRILSETGLIFTGYGGNDKGILNILNEIPVGGLGGGIYWVNDNLPDNKFGEWLKSRDATWVNHLDFDEMMLLTRNEFGLEHPNMERFQNLDKAYHEAFKKMMGKVETREDTIEKKVLEEAVEKAASEFKDWWAVELEADIYKKTDPEKADAVYREGIDKFPGSHQLMSNYALFLKNIRKDYDKAEQLYIRALEIDPEYVNALGSYALFLEEIRKDYDKAEQFFLRSIEADQETGHALGNYALFLEEIRKDYDKAEQFFLRSIEADPDDTIHMSNYAVFLYQIRKEYDKAEEFYQRAKEANPDFADNLGNYAGFLLAQGKWKKGFELLDKAINLAEIENNTDLLLECRFYQYAHTKTKRARKASLAKIKELIEEGVRSSGWILDDNVKRAVDDGHPEPEMLAVLAKVVAEEEEAEALEAFEAWREG